MKHPVDDIGFYLNDKVNDHVDDKIGVVEVKVPASPQRASPRQSP